MAETGEEPSAEGPITIKVKEAGGEEMCFSKLIIYSINLSLVL